MPQPSSISIPVSAKNFSNFGFSMYVVLEAVSTAVLAAENGSLPVSLS
jgi:hypothetical protein